MKRVEGVHGSYVGPDRGGVRSGDRCFILSDERSVMHVRWTTGAKVGEYDQVRPGFIVADLGAAGAMDDEFGFETARNAKRFTLNVTGLYSRGGEVALFEAMESEGHLDNLRDAAVNAVASIRAALGDDDSWHQVRLALGPQADDVERSAIIAAVTAAVESGGELEGDDDDDDEFFD